MPAPNRAPGAAVPPPSEGAEATLDGLLHDQESGGGAFSDRSLPEPLLAELQQWCATPTDSGYRPARIGRAWRHHLNRFVRTDRSQWLDPNERTDAAGLRWAERLRPAVDARLRLGLCDCVRHYEQYDSGADHRRCLHAFRGRSNRRLSFVAYPNDNRQPAFDGELLIRPEAASEADPPRPLAVVSAEAGRIATFLSELIPRGVRATARTRNSTAGWSRDNAQSSDRVGPQNSVCAATRPTAPIA